ncbi:putative quinol monooxygenase [Shewanella nanhaiensis]|uniref:Antibiotic biosynthesis monooxygenase n=1 Tax=Shewanella nanhaiensis TaxID=2864872 RepID=A0ABS7E7N9_9GAMM|nr:antibiotic biosynthesis monooxygenase family protein [Shewanella nanhaiensis]MBW8185037.1 antibiotic biosynthesis monooxygenase [Shewanella nanhaiensis]
MIVRVGEFQAAPGQAEALYQFLLSLAPYIQGSKGCLSYQVLRKEGEVNEFAVIERWDSVESHQRSVKGFPPEQMQTAMPLFGAAPKGTYYRE